MTSSGCIVSCRRTLTGKRVTQAAVLLSLFQLECPRRAVPGVPPWSCRLCSRYNFWTSPPVSLLTSIFVLSQSDGLCFRNVGPYHQPSSSLRADALSPLVSKSVGSSFVERCLHCSVFVKVWNSPTRFAKNGLNLLLCPRNQ